MSSVEQIHRVLARCIVNADFLQRVTLDPVSTLAPYGLDDDAMRGFQSCAQSIAKYAALITAVQNNGLWQYIPASRTLLKRYGLDLRAFMGFREQHQRNRMLKDVTRDTLTKTFLKFLQELLDCDSAFDRPLLKLVFTHERAVWKMERIQKSSAIVLPILDSFSTAAVPAINGDLLVIAYEADPIDAIDRIRTERPDATETRPTTIGYWYEPRANTLRIIGLTPAAAGVIAKVDGRTNATTLINRTIEEQRADPSAIQMFLEQCFTMGLLVNSARLWVE
jgi:hypothetical protein